MPAKPESLAAIQTDAWELLYCLSKFAFAPVKVAKTDETDEEKQEDEVVEKGSQGSNAKEKPAKKKKQPEQLVTKENPFSGILNLILEHEDEFEEYVADETE